jgi:hypothetical protein
MSMKRRTQIAGTVAVVPVQGYRAGYLAKGPGFYVWDEDFDEVVRTVQLLEPGAEPRIVATRPTAERSTAFAPVSATRFRGTR